MSTNNSLKHALWGKATPATIYLFIALAYFILDNIDANVMLIRLFYGLYYLLSFYYFFKVHGIGGLPKYIKALDAFLIVVFIYVFVDIVSNGMQSLNSWGNMDFLWWHIKAVMPLYAFYYFGKKNIITNEWFPYVFVFCFVAAYVTYTSYMNRMLNIRRDNTVEITNNIGYFMVALLPMTMFFTKKRMLQYACMGLVAVFTILSFKRGAVLCFAVSLLFFLMKDVVFGRRRSQNNRIVAVFLTIVGVSLLYYFVMHVFNTSEFFAFRVGQTIEGDSSRRNLIYKFYLDTFINSDVQHVLFGHGVLATRNKLFMGIEAHNDWLEYVIDLGLVGLLFYLRYWIVFAKEFFKSNKGNQSINLALGVVIIIYFIRSFISMSFYDMPFYSNIVLGYCIAMNNKTITQ